MTSGLLVTEDMVREALREVQGFVHETNELGPGRVQIAIRRA
jgi:hypothetical protein